MDKNDKKDPEILKKNQERDSESLKKLREYGKSLGILEVQLPTDDLIDNPWS